MTGVSGGRSTTPNSVNDTVLVKPTIDTYRASSASTLTSGGGSWRQRQQQQSSMSSSSIHTAAGVGPGMNGSSSATSSRNQSPFTSIRRSPLTSSKSPVDILFDDGEEDDDSQESWESVLQKNNAESSLQLPHSSSSSSTSILSSMRHGGAGAMGVRKQPLLRKAIIYGVIGDKIPSNKQQQQQPQRSDRNIDNDNNFVDSAMTNIQQQAIAKEDLSVLDAQHLVGNSNSNKDVASPSNSSNMTASRTTDSSSATSSTSSSIDVYKISKGKPMDEQMQLEEIDLESLGEKMARITFEK